MLRVYFLQDAILTDRNKAYRRGTEEDLLYSLALDLYKRNIVDILNPFENEDLYNDIRKYRRSWNRFENNVKRGI